MTTISLQMLGAPLITYGERRIYPTSPQLFGAALYLCAEPERDISRDELQELLFTSESPRSARLHNLRQLIYRLTSSGFPLSSRGTWVRLHAGHVHTDLTALRLLSSEARAQLPSRAFAVLPAYAPTLSRAFDEWLDSLRTRLLRSLRVLLGDDLIALKQSSDWHLAAMAARTVIALDPLNFSAVKVLVEASLLRLSTTDAVAAIDEFLEACGDTHSSTRAEAERLRRRVSSRKRVAASVPLVGRADTLAILSDAWQAALGGNTQYVLLTGPAGIGKTRVASAIQELVGARGGNVVDYLCGDTDRHRPLSLFVHLAARLGAMPGSIGISPTAFSHIKRLSAEGAALSPVSSDAISSEIARAEIQDALVDLFDAVTSETPLLIVVDDAHLLDSASWAVLRAIAGRIRARPAMLVLCTRSTAHIQHHSSGLRDCRVIPLGRLSEGESRTLLLAHSPTHDHDETQLRDSLTLAAGNPYYLQAIARHPRWAAAPARIPLDIASLAARSYHALDDSARTVLECVLLLRNLATLPRVRDAVRLDDNSFLRSVRILEEDGLIQCLGQSLRCSHELLADAVRPLIPTGVAAVLSERTASALERECVQQRFDPSLAWAAAESWMSLGNVTAAASLLRRCAAYAAHLGEHSEAARMLCQLLPVPLPPAEATPLVDELISYAEVAGERSIRARALRTRLQLMELSSGMIATAAKQDISAVRVARTEADINEVADLASTIAESSNVVADEGLDAELRMRAAVSLFIAADCALDASLALNTWRDLGKLSKALGVSHTQALRAKLIFHTVFGNPTTAAATARRLIQLHPLPNLALDAVIARRNALFALQNLGESVSFRPTAAATYALMSERKVYTEAVYVAVMLAEDAIAAGDLRLACEWLSRSSGSVARVFHTSEGVTQAYMSALSHLAALSGEHEAAASLLARVHERLWIVNTPRWRAINAAYLIRLAALRREVVPAVSDIAQLRKDFETGKRLGRQDTVVEGLWIAYHHSGATREASDMLGEYFRTFRRERCRAEWSLWNSTRRDPFWRKNGSLVPMPRDGQKVPSEILRSLIRRNIDLRHHDDLSAADGASFTHAKHATRNSARGVH